MPKQHIEGLIGQLHDKFADSDTSPQQEAMIAQMQSQLAEWEGPNPPSDFRETAELLYQEMEDPVLLKFTMDRLGQNQEIYRLTGLIQMFLV